MPFLGSPSPPETTQARFSESRWAQVDELAWYMKQVFQALVDVRLEEPAHIQAREHRQALLWTMAFVCFTVVCVIGYYPVMLRNLNASIKTNRALLLLVPEDVVRSVSLLKETLVELTKKLIQA
jgi:hypothetical protein